MNKNKFNIVVLVFSVLFFLFCKSTMAETGNFPVRIGLFFEQSALQTAALHTDNSFLINIGGVKPFEISDKNISIYIMNAELSLLKDGFKNQTDAINFADNLPHEDIFFYYDGSWSVLKRGGNNFNHYGDLLVVETPTKNIVLPISFENPVAFSDAGAASIFINNRPFRGEIIITPSYGKTMTVVNQLDIEEYLYGVLPLEMPPNWPEEALKAQAVAARTYTLSNLGKWEKYGFDLTADTRDQVYGGIEVETSSTTDAIIKTKGQVLLYDNKPIMAFFHSDSGGITEASGEVFNEDLPYLIPVREKYPSKSPNASWKVVYTNDDLTKIFNNASLDLGEILDIEVIEKTSSGRAKRVIIKGTKSNKIVSGAKIQNMLKLKSSFFSIDNNYQDEISYDIYIVSSIRGFSSKLQNQHCITEFGIDSINKEDIVIKSSFKERFLNEKNFKLKTNTNTNGIVFNGKGWGHGIGLSQWGARAMAENHYNYIDILKHYYNNIRIEKY